MAKKHLDAILEGDTTGKYKEEIIDNRSFYNLLSDNSFEERLGEYYQIEGASEIKKRVITYVLQPKT